jgi:hypothetical protein
VRHDHPEPALLVAYLDGTLFHRDAEAVDRHLEACNECTALMASMRQRRAEEQASKTSRIRMAIAAGVVVVLLLGYGLWTLRPPSAEEQQARATEPVAGEPAPAPTVSTPAPAPPAASTPPRRESPPPKRDTTPPKREVAPQREATRKPATRTTPAPQARADTRRSRQPAAPPPPRVMWRTREQLVESSADGGMTWTTDHTADRPIRASVFVNENVAWVVGDGGMILRRTQNGWFGASAPAEGNVTAVTATSPSRATVTLEDGRMFSTANGGVTWAPTP